VSVKEGKQIMTASEATGPHAGEPKPGTEGIPDRLFRQLIEGVSDYAIFLLDPQGIVLTWNGGASRMKLYSAADIIGRHFSLFYSAEDRALGLPQRALDSALRDGSFKVEGWRYRRDGSRFWASVVIDRIQDAQGTLIGFGKVTRDLTEWKVAQEALRQSEERFRTLVQSVVDYAIFMLDSDGRVSNWNEGGRRIKGYLPAEILNRHFSVFYTEEDRRDGVPQRALETAAREGRYEAEGLRVRKDGSTFWASVVIDPIRDNDGAVVGYAKVTRDLTERRAAEEQIRQAQKMEAIGQLTGGVAHDFNNLLQIIAGNADLLAQPTVDGKPRRKLIEGILRAADRGARLTQQLLAFARRQPLRPQICSIRALIGNFETMLRRAAGEAVEIEFDLTNAPDFVRLDAAQFEAALLNLVVNARDAMPRGGTLHIQSDLQRIAGAPTGERSDGRLREYVVLRIADDGTGMDASTAARIFEPFFTTKEPGKGTGLGLSQVYGFVMQSGGRVTVESTPGAGTILTLFLPTDADAQKSASSFDGDAERRQPPTVLIVEDDPEVLDAAITMLASLGLKVLTAADGPSALSALRRAHRIDILFTDVVMPRGMNGFELAREARQLRPAIKILVASGYPLSALSAEQGLSDEFAFISKPYRWAELSEQLRAMQTAT
jgi:PAS domain S-box-containing protein